MISRLPCHTLHPTSTIKHTTNKTKNGSEPLPPLVAKTLHGAWLTPVVRRSVVTEPSWLFFEPQGLKRTHPSSPTTSGGHMVDRIECCLSTPKSIEIMKEPSILTHLAILLTWTSVGRVFAHKWMKASLVPSAHISLRESTSTRKHRMDLTKICTPWTLQPSAKQIECPVFFGRCTMRKLMVPPNVPWHTQLLRHRLFLEKGQNQTTQTASNQELECQDCFLHLRGIKKDPVLGKNCNYDDI